MKNFEMKLDGEKRKVCLIEEFQKRMQEADG